MKYINIVTSSIYLNKKKDLISILRTYKGSNYVNIGAGVKPIGATPLEGLPHEANRAIFASEGRVELHLNLLELKRP